MSRYAVSEDSSDRDRRADIRVAAPEGIGDTRQTV
jgi:hypothetical protein